LNAPPPDLSIEIRSSIPIGSGFGSGAAVTAALMRSLSAMLGHPLEGAELNELVFEVEKMHHDTPSGIDNTVVVFGAPVYFVRGQPPEPFHVGRPLHFLVSDSGVSASTRETVGDVRRLLDAEPGRYGPHIEEIGALVRQARACLEEGDAASLGALMVRDHGLLRELTVSSELLDGLVEAALEAGALGAKLSGGGRGGNVIALVAPEQAGQVAAALRASGAERLWPMTLEPR
jgi:mevalonate kinase